MDYLIIERLIKNSDNEIKVEKIIPLNTISSMMPVWNEFENIVASGIVITYQNDTHDSFYDNKEGVIRLCYE